ncbi:MAG TPA: hypothetical protein VMH88_02990 [Gemmatimonadales bacterium]|nr:hypothetical protein [Gemmatimonadales bacterium]
MAEREAGVFGPDSILTRQEVAAWLKIKPRQVERLGVPCIDLGRKTKRYLAKDVLAWLDARRGRRTKDGAVPAASSA